MFPARLKSLKRCTRICEKEEIKTLQTESKMTFHVCCTTLVLNTKRPLESSSIYNCLNYSKNKTSYFALKGSCHGQLTFNMSQDQVWGSCKHRIQLDLSFFQARKLAKTKIPGTSVAFKTGYPEQNMAFKTGYPEQNMALKTGYPEQNVAFKNGYPEQNSGFFEFPILFRIAIFGCHILFRITSFECHILFRIACFECHILFRITSFECHTSARNFDFC